MEIQGKVMSVIGIEKGKSKTSGKEWQKAEIVIETGTAEYPKLVKLTNFKDAEKFAAIPVDTRATFHIEIESRSWTNQTTKKTSWFTDVSCWKWEVNEGAPATTTGQQTVANDQYSQLGLQPKQEAFTPTSGDSDDLPF